MQSLEKILSQFPQGVKIVIEQTIDDNFYVGWKSGDYVYAPGIALYYPLEEAVKKALDAYNEYHVREDKKLARIIETSIEALVHRELIARR